MALYPAGADPSSKLLLDPSDLVTRLKVSAEDGQRLAEEASAEVTGFFGFAPAYREWDETFDVERGTGAPCLPLYLTVRPVVALAEILDGAGNVVDASLYRLETATARLSLAGTYPPNLLINTNLGGGAPPAWTISYSAGWWLPVMTGTRPAGVPVLDAAISRWAFSIARELNAQDGQRGKFSSFEVRGVKGTLRDPKASTSGFTVDPPAGVLRFKAPVL